MVERLHISCKDFRAVGKVIIGVCGVIIDDYDRDIASRLKEGEDRIILERLPAVDQGQRLLSGNIICWIRNPSHGDVVIEWIWVGSVLVLESDLMDTVDDLSQGRIEICRGILRVRNAEAELIEKIGRSTQDQA